MIRATTLAAALILSACTGAAPTAPQIVADAKALDIGVNGAVNNLAAMTPPPAAATMATLRADAAKLDAAVAVLEQAAAGTASTATPTQVIVAAVNAVVSHASALPLPPAVQMAFTAASALLPVVEAEAGLTGAVAGVPAMSAAQARAVLLAGGS